MHTSTMSDYRGESAMLPVSLLVHSIVSLLLSSKTESYHDDSIRSWLCRHPLAIGQEP